MKLYMMTIDRPMSRCGGRLNGSDTGHNEVTGGMRKGIEYDCDESNGGGDRGGGRLILCLSPTRTVHIALPFSCMDASTKGRYYRKACRLTLLGSKTSLATRQWHPNLGPTPTLHAGNVCMN
jgi:hypothetical protein